MYKHFIFETLQKSSAIANSYFGKVIGTTKPDNSVLTEADIHIGKSILQCIQKNYPDYNVIDEEG